MGCGCHEASEMVKKYHEIRGFCDDTQKSNYDKGLASMVSSYSTSNNNGGYLD